MNTEHTTKSTPNSNSRMDFGQKSLYDLTFTDEFVIDTTFNNTATNNMKFDGSSFNGSSFDGSGFDDSGFNNFLTDDLFISKIQDSAKNDEKTELDETDIQNISSFLTEYAKETKIRDSLKTTAESGTEKTGENNVMPKKDSPHNFTFKMPVVSTVKMVSWESENS